MLQTSFSDGSLPAAGIPWFVAPFGRDSLITGLQTLHLTPERTIGTLRVLAAMQGNAIDPVREEEPGKILHEMRYGEMARSHEIPHTPYYGTVDATPFFVWLFAETVKWKGDRALYDELLPNAERAIAWIEQFGDLDGDGLVEYRIDHTGTARITNQVWKDSYDSLNHRDGTPLVGPIAAVEVQGYVFAAYRVLSEVTTLFGDVDRAKELEARAEELRRIVEDRFWLEDEGTYAQALDGSKRPVASIASNPGHLLLCGLPSTNRAERMIARLSATDMESGWGIRTLATSMPSYNPMSYHNGSVWPHDNSLIAAGIAKYGRHGRAHEIAAALIAAAESDPRDRLPELFCGFPRGNSTAPVRYPVSCSPQAWAAGAVPLLIKSMLGLDVDPATKRLRVEPVFPDWLNRVSIDGLRVAGESGRLTVQRLSNGDYEIDAPGLPFATAN